MNQETTDVISEPSTPWYEKYERIELDIAGHWATVIRPPEPRHDRLWAWKGEFLECFPGTEIALLEQGVHIAYVGVPDQFGSPAAMRVWDRFYEKLTLDDSFAPRPALIGLSRGGLYCYQWAIAHPDQVACIFGDAPVCDTNSWPGGFGEGVGAPEEWEKLKLAFGFESDEEARRFPGQPVDNLQGLAAAGVPILHIYGDADEIVPWEENTGRLAERYRRLGGDITLIAKPGCGHHPHGLPDPAPITGFIVQHLQDRQVD